MHRLLPKTPNGASYSTCYCIGSKTIGWPQEMTQIPRIWVDTNDDEQHKKKCNDDNNVCNDNFSDGYC